MLKFTERLNGRYLWYLIGLITADGCLYKDGRHIEITSKEHAFLVAIKSAVGLKNKIGIKYSGSKRRYYRIQIADKNFYNFLLSVGLMPHKSSIIGKIQVPMLYFADFLRGVIDGDGSIKCWQHPGNNKEQMVLSITSASYSFIAWLNVYIFRLCKVEGRIYKECTGNWLLKYGKMAAREILQRCYYPGCLGLDRKILKAQQVINSYRGWKKSKLVPDSLIDKNIAYAGMMKLANMTDLKSVG
jgi:hypothetical protein